MQSDANFYFMQKGFNSDLNVKGQKYHVQTEDWGYQNPFLVSRVFRNGAVVKTIKTAYETSNTSDAIQRALRAQHTLVVEKLVSGELT
jgi:hypothetical protein